jgi:hypothetical protein
MQNIDLIKKLTQLLLAVAFIFMPWNPPATYAPNGLTFQKGMTYTTWPLFDSGKFGTPDADLALTNITGIGADWIALIVTQYQTDLDTTTIYPTTNTESDADLIHAINQAHKLGLKVMFKPQLDPIISTVTHWRGLIGEKFSDTQWAEWFASYRNFINHYATMAQNYGVEQFCVGVELSETTKHEPEWRDTIAGIRGIYHGPITYAAIAASLIELNWWDAVDYIGVDAYYRLALGVDQPTVADIKGSWKPFVDTIAGVHAKWNKPVLITELGYMSQDGNVQHPWDWSITDGVVDMQEQANAYEAAFESFFYQPWLYGIYWWDIGTDPFEGGPCDQHYTPNDKPAEAVVRAWYGGQSRSSEVGTPPSLASFPGALPAGYQTFGVYSDGLEPGWDNQSNNSQVDLLSASPVFSGTFAISVTAQAQGTFSIQHAAFDATPYGWLEFTFRRSWVGEQIRVYVNDENDAELRYLPLCRYMTGPLDPQTWNRVRIPLSDLNASGRTLQRISFKNVTDQPQSFWIDEIRLIGAGWHAYIPLINHFP